MQTTTLICVLVGFIGACGSVQPLISDAGPDPIETGSPPTTSKVTEDHEAAALVEFHTNKKCREFFNAFPSTFQEFERLYGYDDSEGARLLFPHASDHINYFFECDEVAEVERLEKAIHIGVNGRWDADSVWMFRERVHVLLRSRSERAKTILDNMRESESASFWYFMLDGPHPENIEVEQRYKAYLLKMGERSKQARLMKEQYDRLRAVNRH